MFAVPTPSLDKPLLPTPPPTPVPAALALGGGGGLGHLPGGHRAGGTILATPGWGSHPRGAALGLVPRLGGLRWLLLWHYSHGLCPWHCVCPPPSRSRPDPVATESGCVSSYVSPPCHVQQLSGGGFPLHRAETWQLAALMALPSPAAGAVGPDPAPQLVGRGGAVLGKAPSTPHHPPPSPRVAGRLLRNQMSRAIFKGFCEWRAGVDGLGGGGCRICPPPRLGQTLTHFVGGSSLALFVMTF